MEINEWLNFKDYTQFQLAIALIGSVLWVMAYFFLIKDTLRTKYMEMPYFIACGNFAWEILYAYVFDGYINLGLVYVWGYRAWFFLDIFIFILLLRYGQKQVDNDWVSRNFKIINVALLIFFTLFFYGWIKEGFDNTPIHGDGSIKLGATSAYMLNFGITILYIVHFFKRQSVYKFSKPIAWCKGIGTALFTILFWQIDPENYLVQILGVLIFAGDITYTFLLYKYQPLKKSGKINLKNIKHTENKRFDELWMSNPSYLSINGVKMRYYKSTSWTYKNPNGKYESSIGILEGNILIEDAKGEVDKEDTKNGLKHIEKILGEVGLENQIYYYIADTTKITKASLGSRKIIIDFHEKHKNLKQFILITNGFTRALIKLMTPINPDVINNWLLSNNVEEAVQELFNYSGVPRAHRHVTFLEKRIDEIYQTISKISAKKFDKVGSVKVPEDDPFHGVFTALEILNNDKKEILHEMDLLLNNSQEALKDQELRFKHLFENSYEIIFVIDQNDVIVNFNSGAKAISAARGFDIKIGYSIYNFLREETTIIYDKVKADLLLGNKSEAEIPLQSPDGKIIWLYCKCHPLKISEKVWYHVFLLNNITKQKELMNERNIMGETILNQNQKINEFSHLLSTEFKQQASIMVSVIENLKNSLNYTNINVAKVTALRKALDDMDKVIVELDKVLHENQGNQKDKTLK
jgi:PAS domain S-box-containing protein